MSIYSAFSKAVLHVGSTIDRGAAIAANRITKGVATENTYSTVTYLRSGLGRRGAISAIGEARALRGYHRANGLVKGFGGYAISTPGRYLGTLSAAAAAGSMLGGAIAPSGHRSWGVIGGPLGGAYARHKYGR